MVFIPSLSLIQLAILRFAKQYPGETIQLLYEIPIVNAGGSTIGYTSAIQQLIDLDLIEVKSTHMYCDFSRIQKKSWARFIAELKYPSICAWEIWRDKYIARRKRSKRVAIPGKGYEDFSYVWIREVGVQATQPSEDSILQ